MTNQQFKFNEKTHTYTLGKRELTSVTTFIGKYFEKFDAKAIARKLASFPVNKKNKRGVRYWLRTWKEVADMGTEVHKQIEDFFMSLDFTDPVHPKALNAVNWVIVHQDYKDRIAELRVFDEELGIAGTIDLMVHNLDGTITLIDYKTNKKLSVKGYNGKMAKTPIDHFADCHLSKYTLQLSLYAYILERQGHTMKELIILSLPNDSDVVPIPVPYLKDEVTVLLEDDKNNGETTN